MLHTNISATHKTYLFNDLGIDVNPVYKDATPLIPRQPIITVKELVQPKTIEAPTSTNPEHNNLLLASTIAQNRKALKIALSGIPLAALHALNSYGLSDHLDIDASSSEDAIDTDETLRTLSTHYQVAQLTAEKHGVSSNAYKNAHSNLTAAFCDIPFSADQLKNLSTIVTYAYYLAANQRQESHLLNTETQAAILKRMKKIARLAPEKLKKELDAMGINKAFSNVMATFLLPVDNHINSILLDIITAEEAWLTSRHKLAETNARLVLYLANQYKGGFLDFNDLVQEGHSGLLKAIDRFDHERGFKFSTYAVYWIRQGISRSLTRNERVVRLPFGQMANISKVYRAKDAFFLKTGEEISLPELAKETELSEAEINTLLFIAQTSKSLDTPVGDDDNTSTLADFMEQQVYDQPINQIAEQELTQLIDKAITALSEKEAQVIRSRYGVNSTAEKTLEEIGQELNLTRERVRQIQVAAIKKLKQHFGPELSHFL